MTVREVLTVLLPTVGVIVVGWWTTTRSKETAANTQKLGMVVEERMERAEIQAAYEGLVETHQEDNAAFRLQLKEEGQVFREQIKYMNEQLTACYKDREDLRQERDKQQRELVRMWRKYGENGF